MRIPRYLYLVGVLVLALLVLAGCPALKPAPKGSPPALLEQANKIAVEAENTRGNKPQVDKFKEALEKYSDVVRKDAKSPEAAQAQLASAKLMAGVPIEARPERKFKQVYSNPVPAKILWVWPTTTTWQKQNYFASRDMFRQIVQNFGSKGSFKDLVDEYGRDGAIRIRDAVEQAKVYQDQVALQIDEMNRGSIFYKIMDSLVALTGRIRWFSYWFALILITIIVKVLITPLTKLQFKSMREMQRLQPMVKELQEKYKGDQKVLGEKMMQLYKEHGVNPLSGCLPLLIQMPILILLYTMIRYYEYQFAQGTFLWIGWSPVVHKFAIPLMGRPVWITAANLAQPDLILLLFYTASMIISQRLSVVDPTQADQQKMMSIMMAVMFFFFIGYLPSAFVLYWFTFNLLQTWQQYHVIHGVQPIEPAAPAPEPERAPQRARRSGRRRRRR